VSQLCRVCAHPEKRLIDEALKAGSSLGVLAGRFELTTDTLSRHRQEHLNKMNVVSSGIDPEELLMDLRAAKERAQGIVDTAGDADTQLKALAEVRRCTADIAKHTGAFRNMNNQVVNAVWSRVKAVVLEAVNEHPEIRERILRGLESAQNDLNG
jgi:hypothetical protein